MKNNKALLVDTNRAAVPIYEYLISQDLDVTVIGKDPKETLAKLAKNYVELDYSNLASLQNHIKNNKYDFIIPGCTDLSYSVCSEIGQNKFLGIDTKQNIDLINNKDAFRQLCSRLGISMPKTIALDEVKSFSSVIVKPVDSYSGKGVTVLQNFDDNDVDKAFKKACKASIKNEALIEEYIEGQLYSYSVFIKNKKVISSFFVQEDSTINPFAVDTSMVIDDFDNNIKKNIQLDIEMISQDINLVDGLVHTQFIEKDGKYWIIEMTRRCPGDIYSLLIEFATKYPYAANYAAPFIGKSIQPKNNHKTQHQIIRHTITSKKGEKFWGMQFDQSLKIKLFVPLSTSGDYIEASPNGRVGIIFLEIDSKEKIFNTYNKLLEKSLYKLNYNEK